MKDIDGYVTKDNLYRLISQIKRNPDFVVDDKTCSIIVDKISKMEESDVQPVKQLQKLHKCVDQAATVFFDSTLSFTIEIKYKDFLRFISLYISDRSTRFTDFNIDDYIDDFEALKAIKISDPETTIKLHWF